MPITSRGTPENTATDTCFEGANCLLWGKKNAKSYLKPRALMERLFPSEFNKLSKIFHGGEQLCRRQDMYIQREGRGSRRKGRGSRRRKGMEVEISKGGLKNRKKTQRKSKSMLGHCGK